MTITMKSILLLCAAIPLGCSIRLAEPDDLECHPKGSDHAFSVAVDTSYFQDYDLFRQKCSMKYEGDDTIMISYFNAACYEDSTEMLCIGRWSAWPHVRLAPNAVYRFTAYLNADDTLPATVQFSRYYVEYETTSGRSRSVYF